MSAARGLGRALGALALAAVAVLGPAHVAVAADDLGTEWGGDAVSLDWDGTTYGTATESFVGVPVTVPGDRVYRRLVVTNDGPAAGVLRAWVLDVELAGLAGTGSRFFDELAVDWRSQGASSSASLRSLAEAGRTRVARVELAAGESTELTVGYSLPASSTSGNQQQDGELSASFDVLLRIEGATGDDDGNPGDEDDDGEDDGDPDDGSDDEDLPETGLAVARTLLAALLLVVGGMLLVILPRRRRRAQE